MITPVFTAHIISHTHWDREWYLNSQYTNEWLVPFFDSLFEMLDREPRYRFVLDGQTAMIEDCEEQLARQGRASAAFRARLREYVRARRVLIGPYYLQPDWQLVSDEALVRNLLIGRQTANELGGAMQVGWLLDNFGQISQAPQIHAQFGLRALFVWRGIALEPREIRSEFEWESPDGSAVTAIYLLASYRNAMRLAEFAPVLRARVENEIRKLAPFATTPNVLLLNGYDQEMRPDDILPHLDRGALAFDDARVLQSTPEEYVARIAAHQPRLQKIRGALYSGRYIAVFPGILSARIYLKQQNDFCQRQLEQHAEPLAAMAWALGRDYPRAQLDQAWKTLLKNHPHDSICGVSIDDVHTDMEARFADASALAARVTDDAFSALVANVDTTRDPNALGAWIIFNPLLRARDALIALDADLPRDVVFRDDGDHALAAQRGDDGRWIVATQLPACGYATLIAIRAPFVIASAAKQSPTHDLEIASSRSTLLAMTTDATQRIIENAYIALRVNADGTLDLTDKARGVTYPALAYFEDGGDAGDTYDYAYPRRDQIITSKNQRAEISFLETGPLRARVRIAHTLDLPDGLTADRAARSETTRPFEIVTEVIVEANSPRVQFRTTVNNTLTDHRLRVCFPTRLRADVSSAETQFDVVTRPIVPPRFDDTTMPENVRRLIIGAREPEPVTIFPQRAFVDVSDGARGVAVLNRGLPEYEILPDATTIALTLFRSVGWIARTDLLTRIGDAGPMIATPDAQCLRAMTFEYALVPHAGHWRAGNVLAHAEEFNCDWLVARTDIHPGSLAAHESFLRLDGAPLKVTAIKRAEEGDALIVRFFNPSDETVHATLTAVFEIRRAFVVTLAEDTPTPLAVRDQHSVALAAAPHKIVTLRLEIARRQIAWANRAPRRVAPRLTRAAPTSAITPRDIADEERRAAALKDILAEKPRAVGGLLSAVGFSEESARLQLEIETVRRAYLEARLSAVLLKKNSLPADAQKEFEPIIREIGVALNEARVIKRALEYVVAVYE